MSPIVCTTTTAVRTTGPCAICISTSPLTLSIMRRRPRRRERSRPRGRWCHASGRLPRLLRRPRVYLDGALTYPAASAGNPFLCVTVMAGEGLGQWQPAQGGGSLRCDLDVRRPLVRGLYDPHREPHLTPVPVWHNFTASGLRPSAVFFVCRRMEGIYSYQGSLTLRIT